MNETRYIIIKWGGGIHYFPETMLAKVFRHNSNGEVSLRFYSDTQAFTLTKEQGIRFIEWLIDHKPQTSTFIIEY